MAHLEAGYRVRRAEERTAERAVEPPLGLVLARVLERERERQLELAEQVAVRIAEGHVGVPAEAHDAGHLTAALHGDERERTDVVADHELELLAAGGVALRARHGRTALRGERRE